MPWCTGNFLQFFHIEEGISRSPLGWLNIAFSGCWLAPSPPSLLSAFRPKSSRQERFWQWEPPLGRLQKEADVKQTFNQLKSSLEFSLGSKRCSLANTAWLFVDEQFAAFLFCSLTFSVIMLEIFGVEHYRIAIGDSWLYHIILDGPSLQIKFIL